MTTIKKGIRTVKTVRVEHQYGGETIDEFCRFLKQMKKELKEEYPGLRELSISDISEESVDFNFVHYEKG